jgi:acetaldehyde dehydrogenase/alcohol dehydrogenase
VVVSSVRDEFIKMLEENGAFLPDEEEEKILFSTVFDPENHTVRRSIVGKSAQYILDLAGIQCNRIIRLIVIPITQEELAGPIAHEKLTPVLSLFTANDEIEGIEICKQILNNQGRGHTAVIYTTDQELMRQFGREIEASRILVNSPSSQGCVGLGTGLLPSFTLGCGTFGGNSTTDNIGFKHLLNIKRLALYL